MNKMIVLLMPIILFCCVYADEARYTDYKMKGDEFAVIVEVDEDASLEESRQNAIKHAAELAQRNGYRYFIVKEKQEVYVAQTAPSQTPPPGNMYQEMIIQREFGKDSYESRQFPQQYGDVYPAVRVIIKCYKTKPSGKSIDVCSYTKCN